MERVAARHRPLLAAARKHLRGRVLLLCSTPTQDERMNALARHLNRHLAPLCRDMGVEFLDWWDDLADPTTGRIADRYCAKAYPGDVHFTLETTGLFMRRLQEIGVIGAEVAPEVNYEWSHVFECDIGVGEKTRIWCEPNVSPNNAVRSHKVAASHIYGKLADLVSATLIASGPQSALYINVREGYLPTAMPPALVARSVALTPRQSDLEIARAVLDFWGRTDVMMLRSEPGATDPLAGFDPSLIVAATYPDTQNVDIAAINSVLSRRRPARTLALLLIDPAALGRLRLHGYRPLAHLTVGHRFVPAAWQQATVVLLCGEV